MLQNIIPSFTLKKTSTQEIEHFHTRVEWKLRCCCCVLGTNESLLVDRWPKFSESYFAKTHTDTVYKQTIVSLRCASGYCTFNCG